MSDAILIIYASVGIVAALGVGWVVGRLMDLEWRTKQLRNFLKKDYAILRIFNKDGKTIKSTMVDLGKDEMKVGEELWMIDQRHIYRSDKREKGFFSGDQQMKWEEGVPTLFVDRDHIKPIEFYPPEGTTKPAEISAWLTSKSANELAKSKKAAESARTLLLVAIGCIMLLGVGIYLCYGSIGSANATCAGVAAQMTNFTNNTDITYVITPN
jgi:hypothetical protein